jgi:small conductance mechanosensitive channel
MPVKDLAVDLLVRYGFQVLGALVILAVGFVLARWLGSVAGAWMERRNLEPPLRMLAVRAVRIVVFLFAFVLAIDKFGFQVAPLVAGIGVAGLGIGIAMQGVLSNVVAGLSIIFTKPFRVGEYIELLGVEGEVSRIELFATTLVHPDRSRVVIPNRKIVGEILHNHGTIRQPRLTVTLPHATDLALALALVRDVVAANPRVLKDPAPVVGVSGVNDSGVAVLVAPWVAVTDWVPAPAELYQAIVARLQGSGLALASPRREVRLVNGGVERPTPVR